MADFRYCANCEKQRVPMHCLWLGANSQRHQRWEVEPVKSGVEKLKISKLFWRGLRREKAATNQKTESSDVLPNVNILLGHMKMTTRVRQVLKWQRYSGFNYLLYLNIALVNSWSKYNSVQYLQVSESCGPSADISRRWISEECVKDLASWITFGLNTVSHRSRSFDEVSLLKRREKSWFTLRKY